MGKNVPKPELAKSAIQGYSPYSNMDSTGGLCQSHNQLPNKLPVTEPASQPATTKATI
jgi:hypothetical protein